MRRLATMSIAAALVLSACASTGDLGATSDAPPENASVEDSPSSDSDATQGAAAPDVSASGYEASPPDQMPEPGNEEGEPGPDESGGTAPPVGDTTPPADDTEPQSDGTEPVALSDDMPSIVRSAVEDLAAVLGMSPETVNWVSHQSVTWPDSSLGCPQKGMGYMQVLTPGTLTILEANGIQYRYHGGASGDPFLCMTPTDPLPPGSGTDT